MTHLAPRFDAAALVLLTGLWACEGDPLLPPPGNQVIVELGEGSRPWPRDTWQLQDAQLEDNMLELTVAYGGGCRPHDFWLVAVGDWQMLPDAGPIPRVGTPTLLAHDAHDDPCDAWITRTLLYDLEPLRTAYRQRFDFGPASILVRIPRGQGAPDSVTLDLFVPAVYPPD